METSIHEQTKILVELQKIDGQIYLLKRDLDEIPLAQKSAEQAFEKKKTSLKAAEDEQKTLQLALKQKEGDLQVQDEKVKKLQSQLYQLKSNKEYAAMQLEIKGTKADSSLLEEDILKKMDAVEEAKKKILREKELIATEEKSLKNELEALKKKAQELTDSIAALQSQRAAYIPNISPKLLSQYERLLKGREGMALAPVVNGACTGCNLGLPPQTVNEVQLQGKWITCESCARILYWPA
ncbi:MAG: C4-type zinc ribbon domain-containing protein [Candidatus Omnitrophota bacterium]